MLALLILAYPFAAHYALLSGRPEWVIILLAILLALVLWRHERSGRRLIPIFLLGGVILVIAGDSGLKWELALYSAPPLVYLMLACLFAHSLRPGGVPVITRFARALRGPTSEQVERYTRKVTLAWAVFFAVMAAQSLLLALFAPIETWSLFTHFINPGLTLSMFVFEYLVRRVRLSDEPHYGPIEYIRLLRQCDFRQLLVRG